MSIVTQMIGKGESTARGILAHETSANSLPYFQELAKRRLDVHAVMKRILS